MFGQNDYLVILEFFEVPVSRDFTIISILQQKQNKNSRTLLNLAGL